MSQISIFLFLETAAERVNRAAIQLYEYIFRVSLTHVSRRSAPLKCSRGWSGGAMVLGKLPVPGRPTIWIIVGQGPIALAVGAVGGCLDIFTLLCPFFSFSLSLGDDPI